MGYSEKLYSKAAAIIDERRKKAEENAAFLFSTLAKKRPEIIDYNKAMITSACSAIGALGMGNNAKDFIDKLQKANMEAQENIARILKEEGLPENYLEAKYTCKKCSDKGILDGKLCSCHLELLKNLAYSELSDKSSLRISSFDDFDLNFYKSDEKEYDMMSRIYDFCKQYANDFDMTSKSLIMWGETGVGKTHLSLAIAGEVINKGYGVVYGTAQNLFSNIEREHFGRGDGADGNTEKILLDCDLLILDDLGAEFRTSFVTSVFNNIVTTRLLQSKPTIISTNLSIDEIDEIYSRRIASRILGEFTVLTFMGPDIRQLKN